MYDQLQYVTIMYRHYMACHYKLARVFDSLLLLQFYAVVLTEHI